MTRTAMELAEYLGCTLEGDAAALISGVASPAFARAEDLIYVDSARRLDQAAASAASVVVIAESLALTGKVLLRAADPKLSFARAAAWLVPAAPIATAIHATALIAPTARLAANVAVGPYAVIEDDVQIGPGTQIGAFCFIGRDARVGEACRLHPRVTLYGAVRIGNRVILHSGAVIGSDGFGYVVENGKRLKFPQVGDVEVQDDVEIGANATIDRGSLGRTRISSGTKLDNLVHVAHNVTIGENTVIAAQTGISGSCTIGDNVAMGGQVGIADHCKIGENVIIGAQAGVPTGKAIPKGQVMWGTPARQIDKIKEQIAQVGRLPALAERVKHLEEIVEGKSG